MWDSQVKSSKRMGYFLSLLTMLTKIKDPYSTGEEKTGNLTVLGSFNFEGREVGNEKENSFQ